MMGIVEMQILDSIMCDLHFVEERSILNQNLDIITVELFSNNFEPKKLKEVHVLH